MSQKYGLILNKKKNDGPLSLPTKRPTIFEEDDLDDDDNEEEENKQMQVDSKSKQTIKTVVGPAKPDFMTLKAFDDDSSSNSDHESQSVSKRNQFYSSKASKEAKAIVQKALEEDPNVFAYDEVFEEDKRTKYKPKTQVQGKPKYIEGIMRGAELRKIEEERRVDRKIEKERQAEGNEFDDRETFVTGAYKQKLLERKMFDEKDRLEAELEEQMDVRKQGDMSLFYRHQFRQQLGEEKIELNTQEVMLKKITENLNERKKQEEQADQEMPIFKKKTERTVQRQRQKSESSEEEEEQVQVIKRRPQSSVKTKPNAKEDAKQVQLKSEEKIDQASQDVSMSGNESEEGDEEEDDDDQSDKEMSDEEKKDAKESPSEHTKVEDVQLKPKKDLREILAGLFEKKTVGPIFLEQQKMYFERLAARNASI